MNYDRTIRLAPDGRPIDAFLADYAARTLPPPLAALAAAHLELRPENRAFVAALEAVQGAFLEDLKPVPLAGRDRRLVNIFASPTADPEPAPPTRPADDAVGVLPRALRRLAGCDLAELPWRSRGPELKEALLPGEACGLARFVIMQRGKQLPFPREDGLAAALVLTGAVTDRSGQYERGDIIFAGTDAADIPIAASDGECVCFVVANPPVKVPGPISRVLHRVIGG